MRRAAPGRARPGRLAFALCLFVVVAVALLAAGLWLRDDLPPSVARLVYPVEYEAEVRRAAARFDLDPYLVLAVVKAESGFDARAISPAGAYGLMQLMPDTASWIASRPDWPGAKNPDLSDPDDNLLLGCYYLSFLLSRFGGERSASLAAYNAGHATVDAWLRETPATSLSAADIPFPETRTFVKRVERYMDLYSRIYPALFTERQTQPSVRSAGAADGGR